MATEVKTELQKNAIASARRKELDVYQRALDIQWLNSRMEDGRMGRCLALIQKEAEMEKDYQERTDHAAIVNARARKEIDLGVEVAKVRREEVCQLQRRHYLRERDPSLRGLTKKLQAGYVCRDLQQQMLHNHYRRLQEKAEQKQANDKLLNALYNDKEAQEQEEKEKIKRTTIYKKELQQQLVNREREKQCIYEDTLVEKKMLEEVMRTLADEDQRELKQKRELTAKTRKEMETFRQARNAWKEKQKTMVVREERQIEEQRKMLSDRNAAIVAERQRKLREKEALNDRICDKILADQAVRQERENIIKSLQEQEYLEKNFQDDLSERTKLERVKRETKEALTGQMETRKRLEKEQREREAVFRKETEAKIAADEQKEREKVAKLREKGRLYSQQLLKQIQNNTRKRQANKQDDINRAHLVKEYDRAWRAEADTERKEMIKEHAPHLLGYLQAGVLTREDLPAVREGANQHPQLAKLDVEGMGVSNRPQRFSKCNAQCFVLREY